MVPIGKDYYYHDGKVYKEIKPNCERTVPRYNLVNKHGKRQWISIKQIQRLIDKQETKMI